MKKAWSYHSISGENWERKVERGEEKEAEDQLEVKVWAIWWWWDVRGRGGGVGGMGEERVVGRVDGGGAVFGLVW